MLPPRMNLNLSLKSDSNEGVCPCGKAEKLGTGGGCWPGKTEKRKINEAGGTA